MPLITIIAAVASNGVIGNDNQLIWRLPADLKHFKQLTLGHTIIMGRKTFDSIGKALPGRHSIIITRNKEYQQENCTIAHSLQQAIDESHDEQEVFIIGGAEIYNQCIGMAQKMHITHVHATFEGDVCFPTIDPSDWLAEETSEYESDEKNPYSFSFVAYTRK